MDWIDSSLPSWLSVSNVEGECDGWEGEGVREWVEDEGVWGGNDGG